MGGLSERVVVVGGGQAAARAIQSARGAGYEGGIVLLSKERHVPYERPPLSKECLKEGSMVALKPVLPPAFYQENGVEMLLDVSASEIDRESQRVIVDGLEGISYDRLLIATGGLLRRLDLPGLQGDNVFYLRTVDDSAALRSKLVRDARLLVVGAGFIGLEIAAAARALGCRVTVIEAASQILGRVAPAEVADFVASRHVKEGVDLRLGVVPVHAICGLSGNVEAVRLSSGDEIGVDAVAVGIGIVPDCSIAQRAGLQIDNGVLVDACCTTSDPAIFAAGDVARQYNEVTRCHLRQESWQNAQDQGRSAGLGLANQPQPVVAVPWAWSDQYDVNLQVVGTREEGDEVVIRGDPDDGSFSAVFLDDGRIRGAVAVNAGREVTMLRRMLTEGSMPERAMLRDAAVSLRSVLEKSERSAPAA